MRQPLLFPLMALAALALALPTAAQTAAEPLPLAFGEEYKGEMTAEQYEFNFTFEAVAGDVVVVDVRLTESGAISTPNLFVQDASGETIAEADQFGRLGEAMLPLRIEADGVYSVLLTRRDGGTGDATGPFIFRILKPEVLESGTTIESRINLETGNQYYTLNGPFPATVSFGFNSANREVALLNIYELNEQFPSARGLTVTEDIKTSFNISGEEGGYVVAVEYEQSTMVIYEDLETDYSLTLVGE